MGLQVNHLRGDVLRHFLSTQTTFGTPVRPAAADAIRVIESSIDGENPRADVESSRPTRSRVERVTGLYKLGYKIKKHLIGASARGTPPDDFNLWLSAFGTETINAGTSVVYTPDVASQARRFFTYHRAQLGVKHEFAEGAVVGKLGVRWNGADPITIEAEGPARRRVATGPVTLITGTTGSTWRTTNQARASLAQAVGSLWYQVGNDNSGLGWQLTVAGAHDSGGAGNADHTAEGAHGMSAGGLLLPFAPSETLAGAPVSGAVGSLSYGPNSLTRDAFRLVGCDIDIDNQAKPHDDEAGTRFIADVTFGRRLVDVKLRFRVTASNIQEAVRNLNAEFESQLMPVAATIVMGNVPGGIYTWSFPRLEPGAVQLNPSADGSEVIAEIPCVALASGPTAADEVTLTIT
jgi:hypothetical protein